MTSYSPNGETIRAIAFDAAALLIIYCAVFYSAWVGYIGSDDWVYIQNAQERMIDPFLIGKNHWDVRLTLTWPMALLFKMLGQSEFSAALPTLIYACLTGAVVWIFLLRNQSRLASLLIVALIATSPLLAIDATSLRIDAVETFYVLASLIAFLFTAGRKENRLVLVLAGVLAGLAFSTRPTSVALVAFYGLLFICRYRMPRTKYLFIALGFASVWMTESLYYFSTTGNFFYRLGVDFNHDQVVRSNSLLESVIVAPIKLLFITQSFGLAYWLLPFAVWYWIRYKEGSAEPRSIALYFASFSAVWIIIFSGFATKLVLDPRYLAPATVAALIVIGLWLVALAQRGKRLVVSGVAAALLASHALGIYLENKDFFYAQRWLTQLARKYDSPVYTDPQTYERALFLLELEGVKRHVVPKPAPSGGLFLAVPENAARGSYNGVHWEPADYGVGDWPVIERLDPGRKHIGVVLEAAGINRWLSGSQWKKLNEPNSPIVLYRRP